MSELEYTIEKVGDLEDLAECIRSKLELSNDKLTITQMTEAVDTIRVGEDVTNFKEAIERSVVNLVVPDEFVEIGEYAYAGCSNMTSITIPDGCDTIRNTAFEDCDAVEEITLPAPIILNTNGETLSGLGCLFGGTSSDMHSNNMPSTLTSVNITANEYVEEDNGYGYIVGRTGRLKNALTNCSNVAYVHFQEGVVYVDDEACSNSGISFCNIIDAPDYAPPSVTMLGDRVFSGCQNLTYVEMSNYITEIGAGTFYNCAYLTRASLSTSLEYIPGGTFGNCVRLTSVTIPNGITWIANGAFSNTGLTSVTIPKTIQTIDYGSFESCSNLTSIVIKCDSPSTLEINSEAFRMCTAVTDIYVPWSAGTVSGEEVGWGATNATIHYNAREAMS